jgi:hypothetical protein
LGSRLFGKRWLANLRLYLKLLNKIGLFWAILFVNGLIYEQSNEAIFQLQVSCRGWAVVGIKFPSHNRPFRDRLTATDDRQEQPAQRPFRYSQTEQQKLD